MTRYFVTVAIALGLALNTYSISLAQGLGTTDSLTLDVQPAYPAPYSSVIITPNSTLIDLYSSTVTVSVNGVVVRRGSGSEPIQVSVGGPGQATTVTVTASYAGQNYTETLTLRPADVALIAEPISTTHPFYKGAALLASQGRIRLIAIPDLRTSGGTSIPAANLVYTWKNGDQVLQASSGVGKNVLVATAPNRYRDANLSVIVASQDQSVVGQASLPISPIDPIVRIYRNDPLLGPLYNQALPNSVSITDSERTFRAVPYFFSDNPQIAWEVNGMPSQSGPDITVRPTGSGLGTALLSIAANSPSFPQSATSRLSVAFGASRSTGLFGL